MKPPRFWNDKYAWQVKFLRPIARQYGAIVQKRLKSKSAYMSKLPVICVGNITMGGSGKTPVVQAIVDLLKQHKASPAILLRGYGAKVKQPFWVMRNTPSQDCGDEALLHARLASTLVSPDRAVGARIIESDSDITHIVMDDGLQNPGLHKTLSLLVMDGVNPVGNGMIFPAGPLRETAEDAIKRIDAVIVLGDDRFHLVQQFQFIRPVFKARLVPLNAHDFSGKPVMAFAGIGRPEKFFDTLRDINAVPVQAIPFPDHHFYTENQIQDMLDKARKIGVPLVTTRKDWVRLSDTMRAQVRVLDVVLQWEQPDAIRTLLRDKKLI